MEQKSALLVMDMQMGILPNYPNVDVLVKNVSQAIAMARTKGIPVMYVTLNFRPGAPEISSNNKGFASRGRERFTAEFLKNFSEIHPSLAPREDDILITKRRVSAFTGSDLEVVLRSQGINHLILCGVSTSGIVLSTTREAADKDYKITILSDCCGDSDEEVHKVLTEKVFPRQAEVVSIQDWK